MKKDDDDEMRSEYDFSQARRSRYASQLSDEERRDLLERSAALDVHYWFSHALRQVQEFEGAMVAYVALALDQPAEVAGRWAQALLDGSDRALTSRVFGDLRKWGPTSTEFDSRFTKLLYERLWLVHKGGLAPMASSRPSPSVTDLVVRLEQVAGHATSLRSELSEKLRAHLTDAGFTPKDIERKTADIISQWLAA